MNGDAASAPAQGLPPDLAASLPWPPLDEPVATEGFWFHWGSSLLELALLLMLLFWMVGAWGRLSRLRTGVAQAWGQLDDVLMRRAAALDMLIAAVRDVLLHEAGSLQALEQAQAHQREAALAVRIRPHAAEAVQAWAAAEREMASPLARLQALLEQHAEVDDREDAMRARIQLEEFNGQVGFGRQTFNQAVQAYNDALTEFPTRLLVPLFRLSPGATV